MLVEVNPGGPFRTVAHAIDHVVRRDPPSNLRPSIVRLDGGTFYGDVTIPAFVTVTGSDRQGSIINGTVTVQANGTLGALKVLGTVILDGSDGGYCEIAHSIIVNFGTDDPAVRVQGAAGASSVLGSLIWNAVIGSHGPHAVLVDTGALGVVEHYFRDCQFEMYGAGQISAVRFATGSLSTRTLNCVYQVNHSIAPGVFGLEAIGANVTSNGDLFEDGAWTPPGGAKYVRADASIIRIVNPLGNYVPSTHDTVANGGQVLAG